MDDIKNATVVEIVVSQFLNQNAKLTLYPRLEYRYPGMTSVPEYSGGQAMIQHIFFSNTIILSILLCDGTPVALRGSRGLYRSIEV